MNKYVEWNLYIATTACKLYSLYCVSRYEFLILVSPIKPSYNVAKAGSDFSTKYLVVEVQNLQLIYFQRRNKFSWAHNTRQKKNLKLHVTCLRLNMFSFQIHGSHYNQVFLTADTKTCVLSPEKFENPFMSHNFHKFTYF